MKRFNANSTAGKAVFNTLLTSALLLFLSAFTLTTAVSADELVVNGSFEEPVVPVGLSGFAWATYYGENQPLGADDDCPDNGLPSDDKCNDDLRVPGWSVFWTDDIVHNEQLNPGRLEIQSGDLPILDIPPAYNGTLQKAELDSHHRVDENGDLVENNNVTIAQWLPTCPLTAYELNYAWKSRTSEPGDNDVRVVLGSDVDNLVLVNIHAENLAWQEETVHFISEDSDQTLLLFGSIGSETTKGMFLDEVSVTGPDGSDMENCSLVCDDKPMELTLRYNGDYISNHNQSGNEVIISPEDGPSFPADATILVYDHSKKKPGYLGTFEVAIGGFFSVSGPHNRIPPRLTFEIYPSGSDERVQTVTFHTSCSQPMDAGDEFGAITVWSAIN